MNFLNINEILIKCVWSIGHILIKVVYFCYRLRQHFLFTHFLIHEKNPTHELRVHVYAPERGNGPDPDGIGAGY